MTETQIPAPPQKKTSSPEQSLLSSASKAKETKVEATALDLIDKNVQVEKAPKEIKVTEQTQKIDARVISYDKEILTAKLSTRYGEVQIKTDVLLAKNQKLVLEIVGSKTEAPLKVMSLYAPVLPNITEPLNPTIITTLPIIETGNIINAFYLPNIEPNLLIRQGLPTSIQQDKIPPLLHQPIKTNFAKVIVPQEIIPFKAKITLQNIISGLFKEAIQSPLGKTLDISLPATSSPDIPIHITPQQNQPLFHALQTIETPQIIGSEVPTLLKIKILSISNQIEQTTHGLSNLPENVITGRVIGNTPDKFPILDTGKGAIVLPTQTTLPVDTNITFEIKTSSTQEIPFKFAYALPSIPFDPIRSLSWPALEETLQVISSTAPNITQSLKNTLPTPTPRLPATALFLMAAMRLGKIENWLGDQTLQALRESAKPNLIERLIGDFGRLAQQTTENLPGEWRAITIPLLHDEHIGKLQFFVQNDDEHQDQEGNTGKKTRFLLDFSLSNLGDMQIDGLFFQKNLDLVMRTKEKLSYTMQQDIIKSFNQGLDQAEISGHIVFQSDIESWVTINTSGKSSVGVLV